MITANTKKPVFSELMNVVFGSVFFPECLLNGTEYQGLPLTLVREQGWIWDMRVFRNNGLIG